MSTDDKNTSNNYKDKYYYESEDSKRLQEITDKQNILRKERYKITQSQPWYKKPTNIIPLIGIIIPLVASLLISSYSTDEKEITVNYSKVEPLVSDLDKVKTNVIITYDSSIISNISKLTFKFKNTGNVTLTNSDFLDGPITLQIDFQNTDKKLSLLEVVKKDDANQQSSELSFSNNNGIGIIKYKPSLLNKDDEVTINAYILNSPTVKISSIGKIINGKILGPFPIDKMELDLGFKTFILSFNSFFHFKWLTIFILTILFILSALSSLYQFATTKDGELEDNKILGFSMGLTTLIFCIFSLITLISVLIYS